MINLLTDNKVYERAGKSLRLLLTTDETYVFIDINSKKAMPFEIDREKIDAEASRGKITLIDDKWKSSTDRHYPIDHPYIRLRDENFERIKKLVTHPMFCNAFIRGKVMNVMVDLGFGAKSTLYRYARRYWQRGQNINALLPDYADCGGKGKKKIRKENPLGRPSLLPNEQTTQMNDKLEQMMHSSILGTILDGKCITDKKGQKKSIFSVSSAYIHFLSMYCEGNVSLIDENSPSHASFKNFYYTKFAPQERAQRKLGLKHFDANIRPLKSTVRANLIGPGQSFSIDSTPFDIGVTDSDRLPLGRPTLYTVIDDYSSAYVAFLLVLTPPSYFNVVTCLSIAISSKVEFCQHLGLDISPDDWPMEGIPSSIFADLGSDFRTKNIERLPMSKHRIDVVNSGAGKPDKRSVSERGFGRINAEVKHKLPGIVGANLTKKAGGNDSQLDYTLLLPELSRELAKALITLNNKMLSNWDADPDFPPSLSKTPQNIWKWGIAHRTGALEKDDRTSFWLSALAREQATVTGDLLKIRKVQYRCTDFEGARIKTHNKNSKVEIVRDVSDASFIYLVPKTGQSEYIKCELSPYDRRFVGMHWKDVEIQLGVEAQAAKGAETDYTKRAVADLIDTNKTVKEAKAKKQKLTSNLSTAERKASLGDKVAQRAESAHVYNFVKPATPAEQNGVQNEGLNEGLNEGSKKRKNDFFMDDEDE
jgi:hypothetical protein